VTALAVQDYLGGEYRLSCPRYRVHGCPYARDCWEQFRWHGRSCHWAHVGLLVYSPATLFAMVELGLPAAIAGGAVGFLIGAIVVAGRRIRR
jgi:hypothetical protein